MLAGVSALPASGGWGVRLHSSRVWNWLNSRWKFRLLRGPGAPRSPWIIAMPDRLEIRWRQARMGLAALGCGHASAWAIPSAAIEGGSARGTTVAPTRGRLLCREREHDQQGSPVPLHGAPSFRFLDRPLRLCEHRSRSHTSAVWADTLKLGPHLSPQERENPVVVTGKSLSKPYRENPYTRDFERETITGVSAGRRDRSSRTVGGREHPRILDWPNATSRQPGRPWPGLGPRHG